MAKNLRAKIPETDTLTIFDVNASSLEKFSQEATPSGVVVAKSPREVVENAVSATLHDISHEYSWYICMMSTICSIYDLSWGLLSEVLAMISLQFIANPLKLTIYIARRSFSQTVHD